MSREKIEAILKINGLSATDTDEAIRSVLLQSHFTQTEVNDAIQSLRVEVAARKVSQLDGLHTVFRTDNVLTPQEISELLHVDLELQPHVTKVRRPQRFEVFHLVLIWFLSVAFAVTGILFYMFVNQVGLYHPSLT